MKDYMKPEMELISLLVKETITGDIEGYSSDNVIDGEPGVASSIF